MNSSITKTILSDGSFVYDVVLNNKGDVIIFNCVDEKSAHELQNALVGVIDID